jgi:hypothetical protein
LRVVGVPEVGLAEALEALRDELQTAWEKAQGQRVRFRTSEVTVTVETVARLEKNAEGKIRWWLVEAGGGVSSGSERTQTMTLTPLLYDESGQPVSLEVAGEYQPRPGD